MTSMALQVPVRTRVTVVDVKEAARPPLVARLLPSRAKSLDQSIAAYVVTKLVLIGGMVSLAVAAGAAIGAL